MTRLIIDKKKSVNHYSFVLAIESKRSFGSPVKRWSRSGYYVCSSLTRESSVVRRQINISRFARITREIPYLMISSAAVRKKYLRKIKTCRWFRISPVKLHRYRTGWNTRSRPEDILLSTSKTRTFFGPFYFLKYSFLGFCTLQR